MRIANPLSCRGFLAVVAFVVLVALSGPAVAGDWPTFRRDVRRSGVTEEQLVLPLARVWTHLPTAAPRPAWPGPAKEDISHEITSLSPTLIYDRAYHVAVANGNAYYGSSADDALHCLDTVTGEERWRFVTEGPVRLAPTIAEGRAYFGSDDGVVYCLDANDGSLVWKRRGGPEDLRLPGNGRLISQWPVRSGLVVADGVAYFTAGVFPMQGVELVAVKAEDGEERWRRDVDLTAQGYLLASPTRLYVPAGRTAPHVFARGDGEPLGAVGSAGGSFAIVLEDMLIQGPGEKGQFEISEPGSRERLVSAQALRLVANETTSIFLKPGSLSALDRTGYLEANRGIAQLQRVPAAERTPEQNERLGALVEARTACLRWNVASTSPYEMILAGDLVLTGGDGEVTAHDVATGEVRARLSVDGRAYGLAVAEGRLYVSTDSGVIHCFGRGATPEGATRTTAPAAFAPPPAAPAVAQRARRVLEGSGITQGYAIVLEADDGALAREIAALSDLQVIGVEADATIVEAARRHTADTADLAYHHAAAPRLPYRGDFANLVVCALPCEAVDLREAWRLVRPSGGVLALVDAERRTIPPEWPGLLPGIDWQRHDTVAIGIVRRGPLEGEGEWTHLYAEPGNTATSGDELTRGPMDMQWFGRPGPREMIDRHHRNIPPLYKGGRCFIPGDRIVYAADAYNGTILWTARLPESRRLGAFLDSTNLVVGEEHLFWAAADRVHGFDVGSGEERFAHEMPQLADGGEHVWGWLALAGDTVFGSASKPDAAHRDHTKPAEAMLWHQGMSLVTSDYLFALDAASGGVRWTYRGGVVVNPTIAVADGRVHFVETTAPAALADEVGHMPLAPLFDGGKQHLVCLDAATGELRHRRALDTSTVNEVCYLAAVDGTVLFSGSRHAQGTVEYHYYAFDAATGEETWRANHLTGLPEDGGHGEYNRHPTIVDGTVYAWPYAYELATGRRMEEWRFDRHGHGCGGISASACSLFWRGGNPWMIELSQEAEAVRLDSVSRPGCWINIIPAGGLVLIPEASAGCTCAFPIQTSMAFRPTRPGPTIAPAASEFFEAFLLTLTDDHGGGTIRYTLDGSAPDESSPTYHVPIAMGGDEPHIRVRARTYWPDGRRSRIVERTFEGVVAQPAVEVDTLQPGLVFQCFEGASLARLADLERCEEAKVGVCERVSLDVRTRDDWFGLRFTGFLEVPTDGLYTFHTRSDDGSRLLVGGEVVVDNDGLHGAVEKSGRVALHAGVHPLEVLYFEAAGSHALQVSYEGPGLGKREIPAEVLHHTP